MTFAMRLLIPAACFALLLPPAARAEQVQVPSGQPVEFHEVIRDAPGLGLAYRFRFVAPDLARGVTFEVAEADMMHLCTSYALPRLPNLGPAPNHVVISLSERQIDFGETVPDIVQFFEVYRPEGTACVWDGF
ncbi:hypothetical protein SAMN04488012_10432 [Palleronia salina]|uniref:Acetolactate synthase n=3 Tax=Roseobacteraceae TaxID=2854170 RepID=A0A1M6FQA1_9RHOB|nr:hypothetical protein SAMN04488011_10432 [Palleronia pelagia]SHI99769.1 hypothetical protein SAMN04488012_10432 [Palleronia salina]